MPKINDLKPDGMEFKTMGELGKFYGGLSRKSKEDFKDGNAKFITYMNVFSNIALNLDVTGTVKISECEKQNTIQYGDVLFTGSSETPDECGMSSVMTMKTDEKLYLNSFCFIYRFNNSELFLPAFSKYLFRSEYLRKQIIRIASGTTRFNLSKSQMSKLKIPVPPLDVQREIVRVLDNFTELIKELKHELMLRKKQYQYYRDYLLTFGDDVEWKTLGEIFEIKNGLNKEKSAFGKGKPIINFTDVYKNRWLNKDSFSGLVDVTPDEIERYKAKKGDVFFTRTSETKEDIGMVSTLIDNVSDCVFSGFVLRARPTTNLLIPKFCSYYFSTYNVRKQIIKQASFTTRATITSKNLSKINIPILPIEEQERIVKILDKCTELIELLKRETELREKQYEYYRKKLLTF